MYGRVYREASYLGVYTGRYTGRHTHLGIPREAYPPRDTHPGRHIPGYTHTGRHIPRYTHTGRHTHLPTVIREACPPTNGDQGGIYGREKTTLRRGLSPP